MTTETQIASLVGKTIGLYPDQVATMLNKNGVVLDAKTYSIDQLSNAVFSGLKNSKEFGLDFINFMQMQGLLNDTKDFNNFSDEYIKGGTALITTIGGLFGQKSNVNIARANANAVASSNATALQIAQLNQQTEALKAETALKLAQAKPSSSNMPLIIGASVAGVVLLGVTIWAVTKK